MTQTLREISLEGVRTAGPEAKRDLAERIDAELKRIGFFVISDHGVAPTLIDETVRTANAFFDLPLAEKMQIKSTVQGSPRGYIDFGLETLALTTGRKTPPDLKEGFGMGPPQVVADKDVLGGTTTYNPNLWPEQPAEFHEVIGRYYAAMEELTSVLMELFAIGMRLPPRYFVERFTNHNSTLRLINYPPLGVEPEEGQLRAGAHTDYGALTILLGQDRPGGLQVRTPSGEWVDARTAPHSFVINIGDLMMTWSNDTWLSNMHRVTTPPPGSGDHSRRLSMAYFCNPNDDLLIECLPTCCSADRPARYPPIAAGRHRFHKIERSKALADAGTG
ncbi:MAG: 2OG-Fe(II) oxygenase [Rubritepida sp.]|nr:2OG-Fe(II) oxygenase [Rubritepida sp.]